MVSQAVEPSTIHPIADGVTEDTFGICVCAELHGATPRLDCFWCHGTGYRLTQRTIRPVGLSEQAALAQIKALHQIIHKAASTLDTAGRMLTRAGKPSEGEATHQAANALREEIAGQDR